MDKSIVSELGKLKIGEFSQPIAFTDERSSKKGVRMIYLKGRSEPHRLNLRDDYNRIATSALEEKKFKALEKWMTANMNTQYIMLDTEDASCPQLKKWSDAAKSYASN